MIPSVQVPKTHGEKRKDQGNVIITITTIITMTMTEIVGSETEIDHRVETNHRIAMKESRSYSRDKS